MTSCTSLVQFSSILSDFIEISSMGADSFENKKN